MAHGHSMLNGTGEATAQQAAAREAVGASAPNLVLSADKKRRALVSAGLATLLACAVLLPLLGHKPLAEWDEGIYAEVSREMLSQGWVVPHWNGQVWFEKPPLMLWITAAFFKVFGVGEFWARAGSAFSGVAIVGLLHGWLAARKDLLAAWIGTVILLGTFGFLHVCRMGEMDVLLSLGCCVALIGLTQVDERDPRGWYLFWGGFAIALMTKGAGSIVLLLTALLLITLLLIGQLLTPPPLKVLRPLAIPAAGTQPIAGLQRSQLNRRFDRFRLGRSFGVGLAMFLLAVLPWHLTMLHLFGARFTSEYLGLHVLARATHTIEGHVTHWWFYFGVLLASAAPFVLLYPFAIAEAFRHRELRVWAVFALVVVGFYTVVQTRLPHYIAPIYPPLAVLTAVYLAERLRPLLAERRSVSFWIRTSLAALAIFAASVWLTIPARKNMHAAKLSDGTLLPDNKDSILLLREVFRSPPPIAGPLLLWRKGRIMSIATDVFYSRRHVQQVLLEAQPAGTPTDKYFFEPMRLRDAVTSEPRLILLDSDLVQQIPAEFVYRPMQAGRSVELGTISRVR